MDTKPNQSFLNSFYTESKQNKTKLIQTSTCCTILRKKINYDIREENKIRKVIYVFGNYKFPNCHN